MRKILTIFLLTFIGENLTSGILMLIFPVLRKTALVITYTPLTSETSFHEIDVPYWILTDLLWGFPIELAIVWWLYKRHLTAKKASLTVRI